MRIASTYHESRLRTAVGAKCVITSLSRNNTVKVLLSGPQSNSTSNVFTCLFVHRLICFAALWTACSAATEQLWRAPGGDIAACCYGSKKLPSKAYYGQPQFSGSGLLVVGFNLPMCAPNLVITGTFLCLSEPCTKCCVVEADDHW